MILWDCIFVKISFYMKELYIDSIRPVRVKSALVKVAVSKGKLKAMPARSNQVTVTQAVVRRVRAMTHRLAGEAASQMCLWAQPVIKLDSSLTQISNWKFATPSSWRWSKTSLMTRCWEVKSLWRK